MAAVRERPAASKSSASCRGGDAAVADGVHVGVVLTVGLGGAFGFVAAGGAHLAGVLSSHEALVVAAVALGAFGWATHESPPSEPVMSRFTGPRVKVMRALGTTLPGLSRKSIERRPYPPGQHGHDRKKISEYALRLREKQKLRFNYGVSELQLRRLMFEAMRRRAAPGATLLELLERRLDNVVFRAGFARTIPAARQLVRHGHVVVNGKRVDIPSLRVERGDVVAVRETSRGLAAVRDALATGDSLRPPWLEVDATRVEARVTGLPDETSAPFAINMQLVVEYYAARG